MAVQYWVGNFFIDVTRNQITQNAQSQIIPPKALAVLTYLAKNANKVVSHDELLSAVWPDTVVTPNTLQRSITQLRKVLGEDSQYPSYIKTHAKQGYSLEVEVRWQEISVATPLAEQLSATVVTKVTPFYTDSSEIAPETESTDTQSASAAPKIFPKNTALRLAAILTAIVLACFAGVKLLAPNPALNFSFSQLRAVTSTDDKEFASIYSPDGQYIVFHRYSKETCLNNIWAINTSTQQEIQLTKDLDTYGSHSFSTDGKSLAFIQTESCDKPVTQKQCYKLMSLDFEKALSSPQSPRLLMECKNSEIRKPSWLKNNNIALLQKLTDRWKLISFSESDNKSHIIYGIDDGDLIDYDYSVVSDELALTSIHSDGHYYIDILKSDGQLVTSNRIQYPKEIAKHRFVYPNFTPLENQLIFSTGRQLFTLSHEGTVTNISLPLDQPMGSPVFHPDGKRMLVIKGHYDSDIVSLPLSNISTESEQPLEHQAPSVIARSIVAEDNAMFQPSGELIAFSSSRTGEDQVWIADENSTHQLSRFPMDTIVYGMDWAKDGQSILVNANNELTQIFLDGTAKTIKLQSRIEKLFQWNSTSRTALLNMRIDGISKFVELDLNSSSIRVINEKKVNGALISEDGRLVYTDHMDRFWLPGPAEDQHIELLDGQGGEKRFLIKSNIIYGVNDSFQLWSYSLNDGRFEIIGHIPNNSDYVTDLNETQLLITARISGKKAVAELILTD